MPKLRVKIDVEILFYFIFFGKKTQKMLTTKRIVYQHYTILK